MPTNSKAALIGALLLLLPGSALPETGARLSSESPLAFDAARYDLLDGDLVFRQGRGLTSQLILQVGTGATYSHVGVIVLREGEPFVVHALPAEGDEPNGVALQSLESFAAPQNASRIAIHRASGLGDKAREQMRDYVLSQVDRPFDDGFVHSDDAEIYCTELAIKALEEAGLPRVANEVPSVELPLLTEPVFTPSALSEWDGLVAVPSKELK